MFFFVQMLDAPMGMTTKSSALHCHVLLFNVAGQSSAQRRGAETFRCHVFFCFSAINLRDTTMKSSSLLIFFYSNVASPQN